MLDLRVDLRLRAGHRVGDGAKAYIKASHGCLYRLRYRGSGFQDRTAFSGTNPLNTRQVPVTQ